MSRYLIIEKTTGLIKNAIEFDGTTAWTPPDGCYVIQSDKGSTGNTYTAGQFISPLPPEPTAQDKARETLGRLKVKPRVAWTAQDRESALDALMELA